MSWAVHNLASPAVLIDDKGTYTHDGVNRIQAGAPLHVADTREEAEAWRRAALLKAEGVTRHGD